MIAKITRTVFRRKVTLTWFNETTREVKDTTNAIYENLTESELIKRMEKSGENVSELGKLISVRIGTETEELSASMLLCDFMKYATVKPTTKQNDIVKGE